MVFSWDFWERKLKNNLKGFERAAIFFKKISTWQKFASVHIRIGTLKISHKIVSSFHSFSRKSGGKLKKWSLNWNGHKIFGKNIQSVKLRKCVQFEMDFENML